MFQKMLCFYIIFEFISMQKTVLELLKIWYIFFLFGILIGKPMGGPTSGYATA